MSRRSLASVASVLGWVATLASVAGAQTPVPLGPAFTVDTTSGYLEHPKIAVDGDGDLMIVWRRDSSEIRGRLFEGDTTPVGSDFVVNDPSVYASNSFDSSDGIQDVASDGAGGFVVVFNANEYVPTSCLGLECVFSRRYEDAGTAGPQLIVQPTAYPIPFQAGNVEIAGNGLGTFVAAWEGYDSSGEGVFGRTTAADGSAVSPEFQANETEAGYQGDRGWLDVAGGPAGEFVVAWISDDQGVGVRRFDAAGAPLAPEFFATGYTGVYPAAPHVAYESGGNFLVLWHATGGTEQLQGRVFDDTGTAVGAAFEIAEIPYYADPAIAGFPDDEFIVVWTTEDDTIRGQRIGRTGAKIGAPFEASGAYGYRPDVDTDGSGGFTVAWIDYPSVEARQFTMPDLTPFPLAGKKMKIKDKVPDDPEKRKAQWVAKDPSIVLPAPGSAGDPSCNGDPAGTVKASIRFLSTDSGHDTGQIDLPCQWWTSVGSGPKLSYQYKDLKLFDSPCKFIKLKTAQQIRATCLGKNPLFPLDYDLEPGTPEGSVHTVLALGDRLFCTSIPTFKTKDGSDGKLFLGKDGPPPATCP